MRRAALAPSPLPHLRRKRLGFERCRRRRPPPAKLQRAEPAPAAALLTSHPNSSTDRRGLPLPTPLPAPATPAHPRPSGWDPVRPVAPKTLGPWARRRGRGPPAVAKARVSPSPPAEEGWRRRLLFLPVSPRALPRSVCPARKSASSAGAAARSSGPDHRQTPPPGPRDARLAAPAPPLRRALAPLAGPRRSPGTCGQWAGGQPFPGFPSYRSRAPSATSGNFAVSRVLETPPPPLP